MVENFHHSTKEAIMQHDAHVRQWRVNALDSWWYAAVITSVIDWQPYS